MKKITILLGLIIAGCAAAAVPVSEPPQVENPPEERYELVCTNESGEPLACVYDDNCCEGFVCVKDPQGGRRARFCTLDK